jgi:3-phenylpropionate/trans-cinnamate dioxygenase ferredoxin reductase subunit
LPAHDQERIEMTDRETFAMVGASLAGAKAAEALRDDGFEGRIVLLGAEDERPYERPELSKKYLRGEVDRESLYVHEARFYADQQIEFRAGARVTAIDPGARELTLDGGERVAFDKALITTGAEPRRLPVPGADLDEVLYLRAVGDSDALRERLERGGKVVVIGAGWIGSEVAASARQKGLDVTLVEMSDVPLERVLGRELGTFYRDVHVDQGVEFIGGSGLESFEGDGRVERVVLADGRRIDCDFAVVGIGVAPRTQLAEAAGLEVDNGIVVDERLRASAAGIFAAGDVANAAHPLFDTHIRIEHWANALNQGPAAARSMLGNEAPYDRVPYFYSDQYDVGMEYSGYAPEWDEIVYRGDRAKREFIAFWMSGGRVLAGMNVNVWDVTQPIQQMIRSKQTVDTSRLADPEVPLEELAPAPA